MGPKREPPKENDVRTSFSQQPAPNVEWRNVLAQVTIDMLPDVCLLEIFHFHGTGLVGWQTLVHVCRKWRNTVFGSPRRLNLRLLCNVKKLVRKMLDIWPLLPIVVDFHDWKLELRGVIPKVNLAELLLERSDRICEMYFVNDDFGDLWDAMMQPFPALTCFGLRYIGPAPVLPDSFLGGSAPLLRSLYLLDVPFTGLPTLLLSATHLVDLRLEDIPESGYLSPKTMATALSTLTRLEYLLIKFQSDKCCPDRQKSRRSPLPARAFLPVLTDFYFHGVDEYLEDLVVWMDAPILDKLNISLFLHPYKFDTPQLSQFICRSQGFHARDEAHLKYDHWDVSVTVPQALGGALDLEITSSRMLYLENHSLDRRLASLVQVFNSSLPLPLISSVERLYIFQVAYVYWRHNVEGKKLPGLLHSFPAVKALYISWESVLDIVPALQNLTGERVIEVLPALQTLYLEDSPFEPDLSIQKSTEQFVAARQLAGRPIAVSSWKREESSCMY